MHTFFSINIAVSDIRCTVRARNSATTLAVNADHANHARACATRARKIARRLSHYWSGSRPKYARFFEIGQPKLGSS